VDDMKNIDIDNKYEVFIKMSELAYGYIKRAEDL